MTWLVRIVVFALVFGGSIGGYAYWRGSQLEERRRVAIDKWQDNVLKIGDLLVEFTDVSELAGAVPPEQMGPYVEKLQLVNRNLKQVPLPLCFENWEKINATDSMVSVHLTYLRDRDRAAFLKGVNEISWMLREAKSALNNECSWSNINTQVYRYVK